MARPARAALLLLLVCAGHLVSTHVHAAPTITVLQERRPVQEAPAKSDGFAAEDAGRFETNEKKSEATFGRQTNADNNESWMEKVDGYEDAVAEERVTEDTEPVTHDYVEASKRWNVRETHPGSAAEIGGDTERCLRKASDFATASEDGEGVKVEFKGEFGFELMAVIPFAYFHFLNGSLSLTVTCGDPSVSLYYWFSPNHRHDFSCQRDDQKNDISPYGWAGGLHWSSIPEAWFPPPLAGRFREWGKAWLDVPSGAKFVIISNKFSNEWGRGPLNLIDLVTLRRLVEMFVQADYYVLYNRPGNLLKEDPWQAMDPDKPNSNRFDDYRVIRKLYLTEPYGKRVRLMQDLQDSHPSGVSFNEIQLRAMSRSKCFVSVQGGNSILSSYFGGTNIVFVRRGLELHGKAYNRLYTRLSGAKVIVARNYRRLIHLVQQMIHREDCAAI